MECSCRPGNHTSGNVKGRKFVDCSSCNTLSVYKQHGLWSLFVTYDFECCHEVNLYTAAVVTFT